MDAIWFVAAGLFMGDLWLGYYLWCERADHARTKATLRWWQRNSAVPK